MLGDFGMIFVWIVFCAFLVFHSRFTYLVLLLGDLLPLALLIGLLLRFFLFLGILNTSRTSKQKEALFKVQTQHRVFED